MKCSKCGKEFEGNFCPNCGTPVAPAPDTSASPDSAPSVSENLEETPTKKKLPLWEIFTIVLGILFIVILPSVSASAAFGACGIVGILVFIVLLIVASARKESKKPCAIGIVVCLLSAIVGFSIPSPAAKTQAVVSSSSSASKSSKLNSKAPSKVAVPTTEVYYKTLYSKSDSYKDKRVKFAAKINDSSGNYATITDGLGGGTNEIIAYWDGAAPSCKAGDYLLISGEPGIKALGALAVSNCKVEATGSAAKAIYDKYTQAEEKSASDSEKSFKASCKVYGYKDVARNPNDYKGKAAKFTGKVDQVEEDGNSVILRVDVTKDEYDIWSNTIFVEYTKKNDSESRILEDDIITMYGTLNGIKTYTTVLGADMSIPDLQAEYITVSK